jgi:hypothetical protein
MSPELKVHFRIGSSWRELECNEIEEGDKGIHLKEDGKPTAIGYIPYENLGFVEKVE